VTLSLMNLTVEVITEKYFSANLKVFQIMPKAWWLEPCKLDPFVITGDDKLAIRTSKVKASLNTYVCTQIGFVISTKDGCSNRVGVFTEDHIRIDRSGNKTKLVFIDVIKCRLLTTASRLHADNRASIFGKGRMLTKVIAWINPEIRCYVLKLHMNLFLRTYRGNFSSLRIPWFLPPICGGLGLEPVSIPEWGYKYINAIFEILEIKDFRERASLLWEFRHLSGSARHGVEPTKKAWYTAITALNMLEYSPAESEFNPEERNLVYTQDQIIRHMVSKGVKFSEYTDEYDFDSICNYAWENNFCQVNRLIEEFERVDTFQQMLEKPVKIQVKTIKQWIRRSSRFWRKWNLDSTRPLDGRFTDLDKLNGLVTFSVAGFCNRNISDDVLAHGPSLRIDVRRIKPQLRFFKTANVLARNLAGRPPRLPQLDEPI